MRLCGLESPGVQEAAVGSGSGVVVSVTHCRSVTVLCCGGTDLAQEDRGEEPEREDLW